jgi:hypothetical protein
METTSLSTMELENAIELIHLEDNRGDIQQKPYPTERFCSTTNNLNTLALRTRITRTQANEAIHATEREIISVNGTWQSILRWGEHEDLKETSRQRLRYLPRYMFCHFMMGQ